MRRSSAWRTAALADVAGERLLDRDRDRLDLELELAAGRCRAIGRAGGVRRSLAGALESRIVEARERADRRDAGGSQPLLRPRPDPRAAPHGKRRQEARLVPGRHDRDPARLSPLGGDLADDLRRGHAEGARERRGGAHRGLHRLCERARPREVAARRAEVEVPLVEPGALDSRHDLADGRPDGVGVLPIQRMTRSEEDGVRAAPPRLGRAHGRADAESPRRVVRGRDDAAPVRITADHERNLAQRGSSSSSTAAKKASRSRCARMGTTKRYAIEPNGRSAVR